MGMIAYGVATLERPTVSFDGDFACHLCIEDGVISSIGQIVSVEDKLVASVIFNKVEYTLTGSVSIEGQLSGTFKSAKGLQGEILAMAHVGGFVGTYTYLNENAKLVERKLRLVKM